MAKFVKGQSGNPAGKPLGTRHKLNEAFLSDLHDIWVRSGKHALERVALSEPAKLVEAVGRTLPKDVAISVENFSAIGIDPEIRKGLGRVLEAIDTHWPEMTPAEAFERLERLVSAKLIGG